MVNIERGLRRITCVISGACAVLAMAFFAVMTWDDWGRTPIETFLVVLATAAILAGGFPWGVFFLVRWIVRGFQGE